MCSEHKTFVRVVDRRNLITVERVWSSRHSHTACLASADHPHEALDLIDSSRVLARCRALLTVDADRTPSIDVCRFFGCSGSSANVLERLMMLSLEFGGLTTLGAHFLTSQTPGWNPRVLTEDPTPTLFLSFLLECFELFKNMQKPSSHPLFFFRSDYTHALPLSSF